MNNNILFVDDEQNVLDGVRRQLRKEFNVDTALGPEEGLKRIASEVTYAVVVSDMRMPGMDGAQFLNRVEQEVPNTVRMMLTGNADQQTAIDAVNKGNIFRFLNKPCNTETLVTNIHAGIKQYELINAEKELLEKTLKGSISVLIDILALTNPAAFSCAERIKYYVSRGVEELKLKDGWKFEVAALLSQIGYVTIPIEIMEKAQAGDDLSEEEQQMLADHAQDACQMLEKIPRLEDVSQMISETETVGKADVPDDPVVTGAQLLRVANDFDKLLARGVTPFDALRDMGESSTPYNPKVLAALKDVKPPSLEKTISVINITDLRPNMILAEDIRNSSNNMMIVSKGQTVSGLMRRRLENFLSQKTIEEKVRVYVEKQVFDN